MGAGVSDGLSDGCVFVAGKIVHNDHIAWGQRGDEEVFDIGLEGLGVDRSVEDARRVDPVDAQCGDEGHGAPVAVRRAPDQAFALRRPAAQRSHVGFGPGLVDEDQPARINPFLVALPARPSAHDVRAASLAGQRGFFLNE